RYLGWNGRVRSPDVDSSSEPEGHVVPVVAIFLELHYRGSYRSIARRHLQHLGDPVFWKYRSVDRRQFFGPGRATTIHRRRQWGRDSAVGASDHLCRNELLSWRYLGAIRRRRLGSRERQQRDALVP